MGKAARRRPSGCPAPRFSNPEVRQMTKLLLEGKGDLLDENFHQKLTEEFNRVPGRAGRRAIQVKQVQRWFCSRQKDHAAEVTSSPVASKGLVTVPASSLVPEDSSDMPNDMGDMIPEVMELEFEAKSTTDGAWYDVDMFIAHRVLHPGRPEVHVRFKGFGADEDEWVNVKAIRERSVPLESSECWKVAVGDLVLCFRETSDRSAHFDAHVLEVKKKLHDIRGCRCLFLVQYDHDQTEERVHLRNLCLRPSI